MRREKAEVGPARYQPTLITGIHYLLWTLIILALWPVGWLFGKWERLKGYD